MMAALWLVQRARRNANIVDVGWAAGMGLAVAYLTATADDGPRRFLVGGLAMAWAFRLAAYLFVNRVIGKPEDGRYAALRERWGAGAEPRFFVLFMAQVVLIGLFVLPIRVAMTPERPLFDVWDIGGIAMWAASVIGETIADRQLARFRADPTTRGQVCQRGLWRYSRHPNYFFEWLHWWAYPLLAVGAEWWPATLLGPVVMAVFLFRVTGIPATEAQAVKSRGEAYRRYQRTTSAFVPWFPKEEAP